MTTIEKIEKLKTRYELFRTGPKKEDKKIHKEILKGFCNSMQELRQHSNSENDQALEKLKKWLEAFEIYDLEEQINQLD